MDNKQFVDWMMSEEGKAAVALILCCKIGEGFGNSRNNPFSGDGFGDGRDWMSLVLGREGEVFIGAQEVDLLTFSIMPAGVLLVTNDPLIPLMFN